MPSSEVLEHEIEGNYAVFVEGLAGYLREHRNQFALMRHKSIVSFFDSAAAAVAFGSKTYSDRIFSVQEVRERPFDLGYFSHGGPYADI